MSKYSELLRDPRWQKKRLEILQRDSWQCQNCDEKDKTLHIHHCYYEHGKMPWEYKSSSLLTLCEECHKAETVNFSNTSLHPFIQDLASFGLTGSDIEELSISIWEGKFMPPRKDLINLLNTIFRYKEFFESCVIASCPE